MVVVMMVVAMMIPIMMILPGRSTTTTTTTITTTITITLFLPGRKRGAGSQVLPGGHTATSPRPKGIFSFIIFLYDPWSDHCLALSTYLNIGPCLMKMITQSEVVEVVAAVVAAGDEKSIGNSFSDS